MPHSITHRAGAVVVGAILMCAATPMLVFAVFPVGACCLPDGACADVTDFDCEASGGDFIGSGTSCATGPCGAPIAAPAVSLLGLVAAVGTVLAAAAWRLVPSLRRQR